MQPSPYGSAAPLSESTHVPDVPGASLGRGVGLGVCAGAAQLHPAQSQPYVVSSDEQVYPLFAQYSQVWL